MKAGKYNHRSGQGKDVFMKIAFYDAKAYDITYFDHENEKYGYKLKYFDYHLGPETARLAVGYDAVCAFVNDVIDEPTINALYEAGIRHIALRCAGYNNVDFKAAYGKCHVTRVPAYSPYAVAEHAAALMLTVNRKTHKAYIRTRDNNFTINGLLGFDLHGKTAGIIGTGKIGRIFIDICRGFGMNIVAYDPFPAKDVDYEYVTLPELCRRSDVISLHCPLTVDTHYIINEESIANMKPGVLILNTSRGSLIDTRALIEALKERKVGGAALDVYEEENEYFFEDFSDNIVSDDTLTRLIAFPNVLVTSHQAFFTKEALEQIAAVTLQNIKEFAEGNLLPNEICYSCMKKGTSDCQKETKRCF